MGSFIMVLLYLVISCCNISWFISLLLLVLFVLYLVYIFRGKIIIRGIFVILFAVGIIASKSWFVFLTWGFCKLFGVLFKVCMCFVGVFKVFWGVNGFLMGFLVFLKVFVGYFKYCCVFLLFMILVGT